MLQFALVLALQTSQATIAGTVNDAHSGEPLKAAVVALTDLNRSVLTDSSGRYVLAEVPAGPQHVSVNLVGYGQRTLHALVPAAGQLVINVLLTAEPIPIAPLRVPARIPVRGSNAGTHHRYPERAVSAAEVRNHPLLAEPDVFQALSGGEVLVMPESPAGLHVRGGSSDHTAFVLDGIPILNPYHAAGLFSAWNPDALAYIRLASPAASPALPDALAGVVVGESRSPASHFSAQGSVTTTQTRATVDGPIAATGGYLLSVRSSYPGFIAPQDEGTYLIGESADLFAKVAARVLGGAATFIAYDSDNEIKTAAVANSLSPTDRNAFEWRSRSLGVRWARSSIELLFWNAASAEQARWAFVDTVRGTVDAARSDRGLLVTMLLRHSGATTTTGVRAVRSRTSYDVVAAHKPVLLRSHETTTPVVAGFLNHARALGARVTLDVTGTVSAAGGKALPAGHAQIRWLPSERVTLTGSAGRVHQFTQSVRNSESLVGHVFPVDLHVGAGHRDVPVARSDQIVAAVELRPRSGMRIAAQAWQRSSAGLLLVAARDTQPFASIDVATGSGRTRGIALDAVVSSARFGLLANYGWQRTRLEHGTSSYVPAFVAAHNVDVGAIVFPGATTALKLAAVAAFGRRAARTLGAIEWEACNLLDRGCEFAGSPLNAPDLLGADRLPAYVRLDFGARKHWHIAIGRRDASLALFGTVSNLLGRKNVLSYASDPATGQTTAVEMRPLAPLVVGIDWRF